MTCESFYQEVLVSVIRAVFLQVFASLQYRYSSLMLHKMTLLTHELSPHLAHGDPVDGRLPPELLNKLPLLLQLLHFSFVRKHL